MNFVKEAARAVPVLGAYDVIVVGGGPSGVCAALAAAKNGAKVILVEQFNCLGGLQTHCNQTSIQDVDYAVQGGGLKEIIKEMHKFGELNKFDPFLFDYATPEENRKSKVGGGWVYFDSETYKIVLDQMIEKAKVEILYHALALGAIKDGKTLKGIFVECKEGRRAILGKVIVDTTGSADIAYKSGIPCVPADGEGGFPKGHPKAGRRGGFAYINIIGNVDWDRFYPFLREHEDDWSIITKFGGAGGGGVALFEQAKAEGKLYFNNKGIMYGRHFGKGRMMMSLLFYPMKEGHYGWLSKDITAASIDIRKQSWSVVKLFRENIPGFEDSFLERTPDQLDGMDTHHISGEYVLNQKDVLEGRTFDDSVAICNTAFEVLGPDNEWSWTYIPLLDIPYRCLVAKDVDNLLGGGMSISTDFMASTACWHGPTSMVTGNAAGTAAALAAKRKVVPRELDIKLLQGTLREQDSRISKKFVAKEIVEEYQKRVGSILLNKTPKWEDKVPKYTLK